MDVLQWIFISGISLAIITLLLAMYGFFSFFFFGKKVKSLPQKKSRSKRKRKKQAQERELLLSKRKKAVRNGIILFCLSGVFFGGAFYTSYYQSTNLSTEDTQSVTDSYFYVRDLQEALQAIEGGKSDVEESKQTITYVTTALAGYSVKSASTLNTVEGQSVLNRYYGALSELGINVSKQLNEIYDDPTLATEILTDIDKVKGYQKKAIDFFKINEAALESQK